MSAIRVLLVDDHGLLRAGLRAILTSLDGIEVVGEASSAPEALHRIEELRPSVVLTDISMEGMSGLELVEQIAGRYPDTRTIVLSMHTAREYVSRALLAGAAGYLIKDQGTDEVERAVRSVAQGESYLSPAVSRHVVGDYVRMAEGVAPCAVTLTPRQIEILKLIAQGLPTKGIARELGIAAKTVESHRTQLMERLGIHEVAGLVRYAIRNGLVSPD